MGWWQLAKRACIGPTVWWSIYPGSRLGLRPRTRPPSTGSGCALTQEEIASGTAGASVLSFHLSATGQGFLLAGGLEFDRVFFFWRLLKSFSDMRDEFAGEGCSSASKDACGPTTALATNKEAESSS